MSKIQKIIKIALGAAAARGAALGALGAPRWSSSAKGGTP